MKPEPSSQPGEDHQVLPFRPRKTGANSRQGRPRQPPGGTTSPPVDGLAKYETEDDADNYRHRMMVNVAALLATVALSIAGAWLALQLADVRKNQDCVLSGRSNCMRIETTSPHPP